MSFRSLIPVVAAIPDAPGRVRRERALAVNTERVRAQCPIAFAVWKAGLVRPYWISGAREEQRITIADLPGGFARSAPEVESGIIYPTWTFLVRYAAALGCSVNDLTGLTGPMAAPTTSLDLETPVDGWMQIRYHPAVVSLTMSHLNAHFGIDDVAEFRALRPRAIHAATVAAETTATTGLCPAQVLADLDAGISPDTRILRARWSKKLDTFWTVLATETPLPAGDMVTTFVDAWETTPARLTIRLASSSTGYLVAVAVSHDYHGPVPVPEAELDTWLPVLFSPNQLPHVRRVRHADGRAEEPSAGIPLTAYFHYTLA